MYTNFLPKLINCYTNLFDFIANELKYTRNDINVHRELKICHNYRDKTLF